MQPLGAIIATLASVYVQPPCNRATSPNCTLQVHNCYRGHRYEAAQCVGKCPYHGRQKRQIAEQARSDRGCPGRTARAITEANVLTTAQTLAQWRGFRAPAL
ncbi:hypothetical protein KNHN1_47810 [Pseudomonas guariconensis]